MPRPLRALAVLACATVLLTAGARADVYCECTPTTSPCGNYSPDFLPSGCTNSTGQRAFLGAIGSTSVSSDDLVLSSFGMPGGTASVLLMGGAARSLPFGDGLLCVGPGSKGVFFFPLQQVGATGFVGAGPGLIHLAKASFPAAGWIHSGETWYFQRWYRDPTGPCGSGSNLTNGLALTFTP